MAEGVCKICGGPHSTGECLPEARGERKGFDEASKDEQMRRLDALQSLFGEKGAYDKLRERGRYDEFWEKAHRYPMQYAGIELKRAHEYKPQDRKKFEATERALKAIKAGNKIMKVALAYFEATKKGCSGTIVCAVGESLEKVLDQNTDGNYAPREIGGFRKMDVQSLKALFRLSVDIAIERGKEFREEQAVDRKEIESMTKDLEVILNHVNAMR